MSAPSRVSLCPRMRLWVTTNSVFTNMSQYLLIPHYDKEPHISDTVLKNLKDFIEAGEVQSPKKFERYKKEVGLTPLLFSDWRAAQSEEDSDGTQFPIRQTLINCDELNSISERP